MFVVVLFLAQADWVDEPAWPAVGAGCRGGCGGGGIGCLLLFHGKAGRFDDGGGRGWVSDGSGGGAHGMQAPAVSCRYGSGSMTLTPKTFSRTCTSITILLRRRQHGARLQWIEHGSAGGKPIRLASFLNL